MIPIQGLHPYHPVDLPWGDITRLLVHEVASVELETHLTQGQPQPYGSPSLQNSGLTSVWNPTETGSQLAEIANRHPEGAPRLSITVRSESSEAIARELQEAMNQSGLSYHRHLAEGVQHGFLQSSVTAGLPTGNNPFDASTMLLMTGQLHTKVETPMGTALMVWHREDAKPAEGKPARIHAVSVAIDHPQLGALIAHLSLGASTLDIRLHCAQGVREELAQHVESLRQHLRPIAHATSIQLENAP